MPDWLIPSDLKGRLVIDSYLNSPKKNGGRTPFENKILNVPGTRLSIVNYLKGRGRSKIPDVVGKHLDGKWYAGPAKLLAKTHLADGIVIDKILDDIAPTLHGSKDLAKSFIYAGGMV